MNQLTEFTDHTDAIETLDLFQLREIVVKQSFYKTLWSEKPAGWTQTREHRLLMTDLKRCGNWSDEIAVQYLIPELNSISDYYD